LTGRIIIDDLQVFIDRAEIEAFIPGEVSRNLVNFIGFDIAAEAGVKREVT
jgi:hypothetical protein